MTYKDSSVFNYLTRERKGFWIMKKWIFWICLAGFSNSLWAACLETVKKSGKVSNESKGHPTDPNTASLANSTDSIKVIFSSKAGKIFRKLPPILQEKVRSLINEIESLGPVRGNRPHFEKYRKGEYRCHLKKGRPTYVACWRDLPAQDAVEVFYLGTREKAPY